MRFVEEFRTGQGSGERINDHIDAWHQSLDTDQPLHEYLGMTWEQYSRWVSDPSTLNELRTSR